jgi:hypothetical protein
MSYYLAGGALSESAHSTALLLQEVSPIFRRGNVALSFLTVDDVPGSSIGLRQAAIGVLRSQAQASNCALTRLPIKSKELTMKVMTLTDESFDKSVWLSGPVDKGGALSVVLFTNGVKANAEQPKKSSEKASDLLAELATNYNDKVGLSFFEVDYRSNPQIATRFDIQSAPTFLFLQIEEVVGGNTKEWLKAKIDKKIG